MEGLVRSLKEESYLGGEWGLKSQSMSEFCVSLGGRLRCYFHPLLSVHLGSRGFVASS